MEAQTIFEVVKKLIGPISPVGETHTDNKRFENLELAIGVADKLIDSIEEVGTWNKDQKEFSRKRAGEKAAKFIESIKEE